MATGGYALYSNSVAIVRSVNDLPAPVADVITLDDNTTYMLSGTVDLGNARLVCGIRNTITGNDRFNDKIISTTTGALITMDSSSIPKLGLTIDTATLSAVNGSLFDVTGGSANAVTIITTTMLAATGGTFSGVSFSMRTSSISTGFTTNGFTFTGSNTSFILRDSTVSNNAGTAFNLTNTTFTAAIGISRNYIVTNATQTFLNATNVTVGVYGQIALNIISGAGTQITGIDENTADWLFSGNQGITNTPVAGGSGLTQSQVEGLI